MLKSYLAFDIGGTKSIIALADEKGKIVEQEQHTTPIDLQEGLSLLLKTGKRLTQGHKILGIGASAGGPMDSKKGLVSPLNQPQWRNVPLKEIMEKEFKSPFAVDVDTNVAAIAEWAHGHADADRFLYITVSSGVGGGFLCNGKIYEGFGGAHPEIGHQIIPLHPKDKHTPSPCLCGAHGCLESIVSGHSIHRRFGKKAEELNDNEWEMVTWELAQGIRNLAVILTPRIISLGGGVCIGRGQRLIDDIHSHLKREVFLVPHPTVRLSALDKTAPLIGAVYLAQQAAKAST
jgi:predicted NBD/HSP70 family sugar kinase